MNILVVGGTRFFGLPMVTKLTENGHSVTIATRGQHADPFGDSVRRVIMDKTNTESIKAALGGEQFDLLIDKVAYSSNDVISLLSGVNCKRYIQMSSCAVYETAHTGITESEFDAGSIELVKMDRPSDYALGKRQAERAAFGEDHGDVRADVDRFVSEVLGGGEPRREVQEKRGKTFHGANDTPARGARSIPLWPPVRRSAPPRGTISPE